MQFESFTLLDDIVQVRLSGRLDLEGTQAVNEPFSAATKERRSKIIVDLSEVTFLASVGIRLLLTSARAQANLGGKLILAAPRPAVRKVIEAAGIDQLIGVVADVESARASLKG
jgi:anti-sigma B factor antagonist